MQYRTISNILKSEAINMGGIAVKQALPTQKVEQISPFLLLHHFGPIEVASGRDPMDIGPHPHRGFAPVTFLYSGGLRHKDSRGNEGFLEAGDVQWMNAGRGIIHSERSSKAFLEKGGILEGIQLWVNLRQKDKMSTPDYQDVKAADIPVLESLDGQVRIKVVAGSYETVSGPIRTLSPVLVLQISIKKGTETGIMVPESYNAIQYIVKGQLESQAGFEQPKETLLNYQQDGNAVYLKALEDSEVLLLAGEPINEPLAQWGPYVMNTQTEILEAMRDYQQGKMGFYVD
ncbi:MAG: pirin family protein [Saprospiraceae bacterium]